MIAIVRASRTSRAAVYQSRMPLRRGGRALLSIRGDSPLRATQPRTRPNPAAMAATRIIASTSVKARPVAGERGGLMRERLLQGRSSRWDRHQLARPEEGPIDDDADERRSDRQDDQPDGRLEG